MGEINIVEIITTLGFPIALCLVLVFFIYKIYNQSVIREDKLISEIAECRAVNNKAIETLSVYAERIGAIEADVKEIKEIIIKE